MRLRKTEIGHHTVTHEAGDISTATHDRAGADILVHVDDVAHIFRIEPRCQRGGPNQIAKQHRQLPPPWCGNGRCRWRVLRRMCLPTWLLIARSMRLRSPSRTPIRSRSSSVSSGNIELFQPCGERSHANPASSKAGSKLAGRPRNNLSPIRPTRKPATSAFEIWR